MFDYQAGEKYKLTLIMVAIAGLLAGMFFTVLLMPTEPPQAKHRQNQRHMSDPDITGQARGPGSAAAPANGNMAYATATPSQPFNAVDPMQAKTLIDSWLPLAWDLSAGTAKDSQNKALAYMTPECAASYRKNIWTDTIASQIEQTGLQSSFTPTSVDVGTLQADGSLVITVKGSQVLGVSGRIGKTRDVKVEYLIKQLPEGLRIAGISEAGRK
ncbi:MAG: hypothetical protein K2W82_07120 [Candidatus Obscuribacterales bacterium]|nr:hypothetical protein [Candidatus Obscuribacterales bacterium]